MGIFDKPKPWSVQQTIDHWQWQAKDNVLWSDEDNSLFVSFETEEALSEEQFATLPISVAVDRKP